MKIIQKGDDWSKRINCRGCKAVLQIDESDLQRTVTDYDTVHGQYQNDIKGTFYVECPMCAHRIVVDEKYIPVPMQERIKDR